MPNIICEESLVFCFFFFFFVVFFFFFFFVCLFFLFFFFVVVDFFQAIPVSLLSIFIAICQSPMYSQN